jgi:hypothetical protein
VDKPGPHSEPSSAGADVEGFDAFAAGESADAADDLFAVVEEFVADDGVGGDHEEAGAVDADGVMRFEDGAIGWP